jgi:acetoin utilization deacetylase AcuC-like enzyme
MVERSRRTSGATIAAARAALRDGTAANLAGGTHHAFRDRGEGFCVFNDSAIAARTLQAEGAVERVVIIDCDVHQGNGTAAIFRDDRSVFTFSIHGANNFPFAKEPGDLDVELGDGTGDRDYLDALSAVSPRRSSAPMPISRSFWRAPIRFETGCRSRDYRLRSRPDGLRGAMAGCWSR